MPRTYTRRTQRASYSQEDLENAVKKVKNKELTNYAASKMFGIPTSTLHDRVRGKTGVVSNTLGKAPVIPFDAEVRLAQCLRTLEKWGWGLSKTEVLDLVADFIEKNKIKNPFKNNRPGPDWFIFFRKRHNLSIKKPQPVEYLRKKMTDPFVIAEYFTILKNTLKELKINDPQRIWNLDETSVSLDPTKTKVVGAVGLPCTRTTAGTGRENVTVLTTVNAAGAKLSPLIVFKGKYVYDQWMAPKNEQHEFELTYAASKRGWIESEIFYNYMSKIIVPGIGDGRPVLLIYDGHSTHVDEKVVSLAVKHNITILKLPPHTSHLLQPLDLAVFKSFKGIWDKGLVQWQRQNVGVKIQKRKFAEMFSEAWYKTKPECIQNGFKKGGIYPFNSDVIPIQKYDPMAFKRWQKHNLKKSLSTLTQLCINHINTNVININTEFKDLNLHSNVNSEKTDYNNTSFEELLLKKVNQHNKAGQNRVNKMKRVAKGAEVITYTYLESINQIKDLQKKTVDSNGIAQETQSKVEEIPVPIEMTNTKTIGLMDYHKPGPSGILKKKSTVNRKPNIVSKETIKQKDGKSRKSNSMNNNSNQMDSLCKKGKGIGKKSRANVIENININQTINGADVTFNMTNLEHLNTIINDEKFSTQDNKIEHSFKKVNTKKTNRFVKSSSTTSVSSDISYHSDSDIIDIFSDINYENEELDILEITDLIQSETYQENNLLMDKELTVKDSMGTENNLNYDTNENKKVTILSSVRFTADNQPFIGSKSCGPLKNQPINKVFHLSTNLKRKDTQTETIGKENIPEKRPKTIEKNTSYSNEVQEKNQYHTGDTVLTRYFTNCWKYYVGVIQNTFLETKKYAVSYYKTVGKKSNVEFVVPKRKDQDCIPEISIVKKIDLLQINEHPVKKYVLMNDEDVIYF